MGKRNPGGNSSVVYRRNCFFSFFFVRFPMTNMRVLFRRYRRRYGVRAILILISRALDAHRALIYNCTPTRRIMYIGNFLIKIHFDRTREDRTRAYTLHVRPISFDPSSENAFHSIQYKSVSPVYDANRYTPRNSYIFN